MSRAMKNPEVRRRMSEAAARTFHSDTTKLKIKRTVRDRMYVKMHNKLSAQSKERGIRRGKVGIVSIGPFARRVSGVATASYGRLRAHSTLNNTTELNPPTFNWTRHRSFQRRLSLTTHRARVDASIKPPLKSSE